MSEVGVRSSVLTGGLVLALAILAAAQDPPGDEVVLKRGTQHHVRRDRAVGLVGLEPATGDRPARARVSVSAGAYSLTATLGAGERVRLGGVTLEVLAVEPPTTLRLRRAAGGDEAEPLRAAPAAQEGLLLLAPLAIYTLPDGRAVGVGNVRPDGEGGAPVVTLTVFPAGFREDPTRGYDLHVDAGKDALLDGTVAKVRVKRLEADQVALELSPPR